MVRPESGGELMGEPLLLTLEPDQVAVDPGEMTRATARVENRAESLDTLSLSLEGLPETWYTLTVRALALFPGDREEVRLALHPPPDAQPGEHAFRLLASSQDDPGRQATAAGRLRVGRELLSPGPPEPPPTDEDERPGVTVLIRTPEVELRPGDQLEVLLRVQNTGEAADRYHLSILGLDPRWVHLEPTSLSLSPGEAEELSLVLSVPPRAGAPGQYDYVLRAVSGRFAGVRAEARGTLRVRPPAAGEGAGQQVAAEQVRLQAAADADQPQPPAGAPAAAGEAPARMRTARNTMGMIFALGGVGVLFSLGQGDVEVDLLVWIAAVVLGAVFWNRAGRFLAQPTQAHLEALQTPFKVFVGAWILAALATLVVWEELVPGAMLGVVLFLAASYFMNQFLEDGKALLAS